MQKDDFTLPEGFKIIPGFESYAIDISGNVIRVTDGKENFNQARAGKQLKQGEFSSGYNYVPLVENGKQKKIRTHRLVMLTFVGPSDLQVNHIDGNKNNNHLKNLEYCTSRENMDHAMKNNLRAKGDGHGRSKLSEIDIYQIRKLSQEGALGLDLAKSYKVSSSTIYSILSGKTWKHVT